MAENATTRSGSGQPLQTSTDPLGQLLKACFEYATDVAAFLVAVEPRIKTAVLLSGGARKKVAPEVDPWNFAPRMTVPVLMINGRPAGSGPIASVGG
jgi:hypothetical protein